MTENTSPLTARDTIARWLADPRGAAAIGGLLSAIGQDESALAVVRNLPLQSLVDMSQGRLSQDVVDDLVRQVNGGVIPEPAPAAPASARFEGRTVIVSGAASGIGRAVAQRVLAEGGRVVAVDVAAEGLQALVESAPEGRALAAVADITDDASIEQVIAAAEGRIDALANVAGIMDGMVPLHEVDDELWDRLIGVNVTGSFKLSRAVLPLMLAAGKGSIVNVASEASLRGNAAGTAYTVSKHAVVGLTRSSAFLYGPSGIRTNAVAPGPTATAIQGDFRSEFGKARLGPFMALIPPVTTAEQLAASICWLLSDDSANVNGQVLASDGGWSVQ